MSNTSLSKDADKLICSIYRDYLKRRKAGVSKADAKYLGDSKQIHLESASDWLFEDVDDTCRELDSADFLENLYASDVVVYSELTNKAIVYMETRFKRGLLEVVDFISKFK